MAHLASELYQAIGDLDLRPLGIMSRTYYGVTMHKISMIFIDDFLFNFS